MPCRGYNSIRNLLKALPMPNTLFRATLLRCLAPLLVLALFLCTNTHAAEVIENFRSEVQVAASGLLTVTETITVQAEDAQIRRGIFRDFPTTYRAQDGTVYRVGFDVVSVERDGQPEPFAIENISNGKRIRIGHADVFLQPGRYTYRITYTTSGQLGFFEHHDELYWNATGHGWAFPIEQAEALVRLPGNIRALDYTAYTGREGTRGKSFIADRAGDSRIGFTTTRALAPGEGLTIVVTWPKGVVAEPNAAQRSARFLRQNLSVFVASMGFLGLFGFYFWTWLRVGRDPPSGAIFPRFEPPKNLSPAATRFIWRMGYDRKSFAAALINMGVKGFLRIEDDDKKFELTKLSNATSKTLSSGEKKIASILFAGKSKSIRMQNESHKKFGNSISKLRESLETEYEKQTFVRNQIYFWFGIGLTFLIAVAAASTSPMPVDAILSLIFVSLWAGGGGFLIVQSWRRVTAGASSFGDRVGSIIHAVFNLSFMIPIVVGLVLVGSEFAYATSFWTPFLLAGTALLNLVFFEILKAPTLAGRQLMDEIEGFRMFLGTAEEERLEMLTPPEKTPELFEKYLPYAIALDVENTWSERFADVLAHAAAAPESSGNRYHSSWYSGNRFGGVGSRGFAGALSGALSSAAASAATAPGSSSGSGGGGFSGGGGGGGGGGGW